MLYVFFVKDTFLFLSYLI